ncbi:hypothetical protein B0T20DRAFT_400803, partial [Sordaria brevicollis]
MAASSAADGTQPQFHTDNTLLPDLVDLAGHHFDFQPYFDFNIANDNLHDTWRPPFNKRLPRDANDPQVTPAEEVTSAEAETLYDAWKRVRIPYLDCNVFGDNFGDIIKKDGGLETWEAYEEQHNGLWQLRQNFHNDRELFVPQGSGGNAATIHSSKQAIHHLAYRIISQIQQQEGALLGAFRDGRWWIAPPTEAIELPLVQTPNGALSGSLSPAELTKARAASYTVHWVCYTDTNHIAVIIREAKTGHSWYFDSASAHSQNDENHQLVLSGLHRWCLKYNINIPNGNRHRQVVIIPHDLAWTCGLHSIAHTLAFLRFGLLGWHDVPRYKKLQSNESKLKEMRHDLMKALELSMGYRPTIRLPEHYDNSDNVGLFRFPSYRSVDLTKEDLHDCGKDPFTKMIDEHDLDEESKTMLHHYYRRAHIECHDGISIQEEENGLNLFSYTVYAELHNGLHNMRNREYLGAKQVHYHAARLITKVQQSESAHLGPARAENQEWWIAPDEYIIKCQIHKTTGHEEDQHGVIMALSEMNEVYAGMLMEGKARNLSEDRQKYLRAKYTVHWVHHSKGAEYGKGNHWAVIVREEATNFAWYFDSMEDDRERRFNHAVKVFNEWLAKSGVTEVSESFMVPALEQEGEWECGLHAIAHAMAFLRFGVLEWDKLPGEAFALNEPPTGAGDNASGLARLDTAKRLCGTMTSALHGLMGVAWPRVQPPFKVNGDKANTGTTEKTGTDSGHANGRASETQPSAAMGSSNQPPSQGNGDKANKGTTEKTGTHPSKSSGKDSVPHPSFFDQDAYNQQVPGFRFPTYPSIPLEPHLVRPISDEPYNARLKKVDEATLRNAYEHVDKVCCDKVSLMDRDCKNALKAYKEINNALFYAHNSQFLEDYGMYHLACRLFSIVMATGPNTP